MISVKAKNRIMYLMKEGEGGGAGREWG